MEVFANIKKEHDTDCFRQLVYDKSAKCCHAHKEELIEHLAVEEMSDGLPQHFSANQQISCDENDIFHEHIRCPVELRLEDNTD